MVKLSVNQMLLKARACINKKDGDGALEIYERILDVFPGNIRAKNAKAKLLNQKTEILSTIPSKAITDALFKLFQDGYFAQVIVEAQKNIKKYPSSFVIWNILGAASIKVGELNSAKEAFQRVVALNPNYAEGYNSLAVSLHELGQNEEALHYYSKAISLKPKYVEAHFNLGNALFAIEKHQESAASYSEALSLRPNYAEAYFSLGNALCSQGLYDAGIEAYQKAISISPDYLEAYVSMGTALKDQGNLALSVQYFEKAISIDPNHGEAQFNLGLTHLNMGNLKLGLEKYEWRWLNQALNSHQRYFAKPSWNGVESLADKKILLWSEQGPGDVVMWLSALKYLLPLAKKCIIECPEKLLLLFRRSFPEAKVRIENKNSENEPADFDVHLPIGSLYKCFLPQLSSRQSVSPYLIPDTVRVDYWKERLNSVGKGPFIGIAWSSPLITARRQLNYTQISEWAPIFSIPNVTFINLQSKDFEKDLCKIKEEFNIDVYNFYDLDHYDNLDEVAALSAALDMCISVSTAVSTITAGVGCKTKLLHWKQSAWNNILFTPAGPSVKVFERDTQETWSKSLNEIAHEIQSELKIL